MFDIGFSELLVIAVVALIVIGPERLPKVARTAGHLLGRLQRYVGDVKADINREMQLEELKKLQAEVQESARTLERSVSDEMRAVESAVGGTMHSLNPDLARHFPVDEAAALPGATSASTDALPPPKAAETVAP